MTLLAPQKAWKDLMRKLVLVYPTLPVTRTLHFVENIGFQVSFFYSRLFQNVITNVTDCFMIIPNMVLKFGF